MTPQWHEHHVTRPWVDAAAAVSEHLAEPTPLVGRCHLVIQVAAVDLPSVQHCNVTSQCHTRMSHHSAALQCDNNAALQCHITVLNYNVTTVLHCCNVIPVQHCSVTSQCSTAVSHRSAALQCHITVPHQNVTSQCRTAMWQQCCTAMSHHSVTLQLYCIVLYRDF